MQDQENSTGFTKFSEAWNGRLAMIGFSLAVVTEILTGQGIIGQVQALLTF
ncbi:MAG: chlorophyll a/b-binding protein [Thermosynechococcaceae cyanobacterium]